MIEELYSVIYNYSHVIYGHAEYTYNVCVYVHFLYVHSCVCIYWWRYGS